MVRLFIALLLPDSIKQILGDLIADLKPRARDIKWVAPENLHLTVKFIGETPEKNLEPINRILEAVVSGKSRLEVRLAGCGGFPDLRNPRVIWVGLEGGGAAGAWARELNIRLVPLGIEAERRPFSPHLTLGRVRQRGDFSSLAAHMDRLNFDAGLVVLDRIALVRSTLMPGGPIYTNLNIYTLT